MPHLINYWDAIIDVVDVDENGKLGEVIQSFKQFYRPEEQWRQVGNREDHWGNRQVGPHAHCAHFWHDWVFIPDQMKTPFSNTVGTKKLVS